ncbi:uncharacterized protein [Argopecten irradians]|uniref:uncharacterized protein isoform X1 n=1 Tax=Argopecten irradians TaxID=31199 RepID=UPI003713D309
MRRFEMGDYVSNYGDEDTEFDDDTSDIWDISEIPIPGSPGERTFSVSPKPSQSNSTGSQNYGEEYKKSSRNVVNLESESTSRAKESLESTKYNKHRILPIAPILKCYKIIGPPRISAGQRNFDDLQILQTDESEYDTKIPTEVTDQNELSSFSTPGKTRRSRRIFAPDILPDLDKISEEEELLYESTEGVTPITSTPTRVNSTTLTSFRGIKLLGMSIE